MALKFNFWETLALQTGISALSALVSSKNLTDQQKADINAALLAVQKVEIDFAA